MVLESPDNTVLPDHPVLPPELEFQIFEICACSRPVLIPKLMLVAWRVKEWVEPLLYRTIALTHSRPIEGYPTFTTDIVLSAIRTKGGDFFRDSVRNLFLFSIPEYAMKKILSVCIRVENLWAVAEDADVSSIMSLCLKQLYVDLFPLFSAIQSGHPLFAEITHLELMGPDEPLDTEIWCSTLSLLPRLTHLSFNNVDFISVCLPLLQKCKHLSVLVSLDVRRRAIEPLQDGDALTQDVRFVVIRARWFLKDWQMGIHAGRDYWSRAESFIAKRRSGEIDARQYKMLEDETVYIK
ncbi:hypothetical protein C8R44DRAFT_875586 [Mycena epipterygia]|nr:hypothetical protein C8R44DRAFT_875586 [Mycena epipterygia]